MRVKTRTVFLYFAVSALNVFSAPLLNKLSPAEVKAGWILLFDGVNKTGWHTGLTGTANTWNVEDSSLTNPMNATPVSDFSGAYEIWTNDTTFSNFEFSAEWKLTMKGNSGIYIRVDRRNRSCSGEEFAILDDVNGDDANGAATVGHMPGETGTPIKRTAADYDMYPTTQNGAIGGTFVSVAKPYDQWNKGVIWANDSLMEHWLNGQKVTDYRISSDTTSDWYKRFKLSKYYNQTCPASMSNYRQTWGRKRSGPIGMQDHGGNLRIWFRNIKIRPFTPGEKLVSPLITPIGRDYILVSWIQVPVPSRYDTIPVKVILETAVTGSVVHYTLDGTEPTEASPIYTDTLRIKIPNTTVKAKTFRTGFQTSDLASATFHTVTVSTFKPDSHQSLVEFMQRGRRLSIKNIKNNDGRALAVDLLSVSGETRASFAVKENSSEIDLQGLEAGLYWVRMHGATGRLQTQRIFLP